MMIVQILFLVSESRLVRLSLRKIAISDDFSRFSNSFSAKLPPSFLLQWSKSRVFDMHKVPIIVLRALFLALRSGLTRWKCRRMFSRYFCWCRVIFIQNCWVSFVLRRLEFLDVRLLFYRNISGVVPFIGKRIGLEWPFSFPSFFSVFETACSKTSLLSYRFLTSLS